MTWTQVRDYPDYEINRDTAEVRRASNQRPIKPLIDLRGRVLVRLYVGRQRHTMKVGRLMLLTFVGPPPEPDQVARHLNDDPGDNRLGNLAWGTQSDNMFDKVANGLHWNANKTHCVNGHEFTPANTGYERGGRKRVCLACGRMRARERRRVHKELMHLVDTKTVRAVK